MTTEQPRLLRCISFGKPEHLAVLADPEYRCQVAVVTTDCIGRPTSLMQCESSVIEGKDGAVRQVGSCLLNRTTHIAPAHSLSKAA